jgi:hypothetical protein
MSRTWFSEVMSLREILTSHPHRSFVDFYIADYTLRVPAYRTNIYTPKRNKNAFRTPLD